MATTAAAITPPAGCRKSGATKFKATRCDLIFGANSHLRQLAQFYAQQGGHEKLVKDFVAAWNKVMMHDRFDVADKNSAAI